VLIFCGRPVGNIYYLTLSSSNKNIYTFEPSSEGPVLFVDLDLDVGTVGH
jgi:hypothetical protein